MKLRFDREEMAEALRALCGVTAVRTPKPILSCVRIEARSDVVLMHATDLEIALRCSATQVEVDEPGAILVVADTISRIVHECADDTLAFETVDNLLHVRGEGSHFQIVTQDVAEFPPVPAMDGEPDFVVGHDVIHRLIEWTVFASARESTRYAINGVLWEVKDVNLVLAATDGRRLSLARAKLDKPVAQSDLQAIVPTKALSLFGKLPAGTKAPVRVKITDNLLVLETGGALISTALVEGHFPKYEDVIPGDCNRIVHLNTAEFQSALKRAALLTNEESKGVRLSLTDGSLTLSSRAPEQGEATISLPVRYDDGPLDIGFNPTFLLDVLRVAHAEEITMALKEANRPGVIRLGEDFVYVVMPVNLASA